MMSHLSNYQGNANETTVKYHFTSIRFGNNLKSLTMPSCLSVTSMKFLFIVEKKIGKATLKTF